MQRSKPNSRERRQCLHRDMIGYDQSHIERYIYLYIYYISLYGSGYDQLWFNVIGPCDKSRLLFSCELSAWGKKIMALLTTYKVSKLTHPLKYHCYVSHQYKTWNGLKAWWLSVSEHSAWWNEVSSCLWQCLQGFYDDDSNKLTIKKNIWTSVHY